MTRIILITGGSRGIGAETARLAASKGYTVCFTYAQNEVAAAELVAEITELGQKAFAYKADVASESETLELFKIIDSEVGTLSALVNNAGILGPKIRVEEITQARLEEMFSVNVFGTFLASREAIKRMSSRHGGNGGSIVNVSSAASRAGSPNEFVDYAAAKGAIDTFTLGLSKEVATEGIRVNAVRPGLIYTDLHASCGHPDRVDALKANVPMQRGGSAKEVAQAILWLLSDESSYVTGALLDVAGGR